MNHTSLARPTYNHQQDTYALSTIRYFYSLRSYFLVSAPLHLHARRCHLASELFPLHAQQSNAMPPSWECGSLHYKIPYSLSF